MSDIEVKPTLDSDPVARSPMRVHPTEQHMITYTVSDDQLDFIGGSGTRFTILTTLAAFFGSAALSCFLAGQTVNSNWSPAQYGAFCLAPIFAGVIAFAFAIWAVVEYQNKGSQVKRIKNRSYEPGTLKTLKDLNESKPN
jgi:hypothetical protein